MIDEELECTSLYDFALLGRIEDFDNKLIFLATKLAKEEIWDFDEKNGIKILKNYILITFSRCKEQNKILYSNDEEYCATNTGLLSKQDKDIMMVFKRNANEDVFNKNPYQKKWYFQGFKTTSDRDYLEIFEKEIPEMATYTDNFEDYYFNPNIPIDVVMEHIIDDNWERIKKEIDLPKSIVKILFEGVLKNTINKAKRNYYLAIPQFHKGHIGYFLPLDFPIDDDKYVTMALSVEKIGGVYRGNTIFNIKDAYAKSRILMKPDTNWLLKDND